MSESIIQMFLELQQLSATAHVLGNLLQCPTTQHERNLKLIKTLICRKVPISTVFSSKCQEKSVFLKIFFRKPEFSFDLNFFLKLTAKDCSEYIYNIYAHIYIHCVCVYICCSYPKSYHQKIEFWYFSLFREFWLFIASLKRGFRKQQTPAFEKLFPDSQAMLKLRLVTVIPATPPSYLHMYGDSTSNDSHTFIFPPESVPFDSLQ